MISSDSIQSRRSAILAAAEGKMRHARRLRVRHARLATVALLASLGWLVARVPQRDAAHNSKPQAVAGSHAIDFASVGAADPVSGVASDFAIDFAIVTRTSSSLLATLTDDEAEAALAEEGYCVKILRVADRPLLVDCSTGQQAVIR